MKKNIKQNSIKISDKDISRPTSNRTGRTNHLKKDKNILYTGFGDKGTTTLFDCKQTRISKSALVIEALGSIDELNAYLGIMKVYSEIDKITLHGAKSPNNDKSQKPPSLAGNSSKAGKNYSQIIEDIQQNLFVIQAELGGSKMSVGKNELNKIEKTINQIGEILPPITSFTISGGSIISSGLDFARTLARKSERRVISVLEEGMRVIDPKTISYLNRLSSVLFALSRYANYIYSIPENHPDYNKK